VDPRVREAAIAGVKWLLDLQNRDGGIPTFCRGWTNLPFDRSSPDITAHALRAWLATKDFLPMSNLAQAQQTTESFTKYLQTAQLADGSWLPLWFGNQHRPDESNPIYGTAKVLRALVELVHTHGRELLMDEKVFNFPPEYLGDLTKAGFSVESMRATKTPSGYQLPGLDANRFNRIHKTMERGVRAMVAQQNPDGSWGESSGQTGSREETALALETLAAIYWPSVPELIEGREAISRGTDWLLARVEDDTWTQPAPIGFYFAKLWYYERLYPMVFTVAALEAVARLEATESR
jgi:squalene-hopene/tetraprenyl-beta-curcumene cyclase